MDNSEKEALIRKYFEMWVERDFSSLNEIFSNEVYYSECYGPEYCSLKEIYVWIEEMLKRQVVLEWTIKRFIHSDRVTVVEWFFKEKQGTAENSFDGVSLIEFDERGKITIIKEFQSKAEHIAPYANLR